MGTTILQGNAQVAYVAYVAFVVAFDPYHPLSTLPFSTMAANVAAFRNAFVRLSFSVEAATYLH